MKATLKLFVLIAVASFVLPGAIKAVDPEMHAGKSSLPLATGGIEKAMGKAGEMKGDVYKISLPRKDLSVTLNGVKVKPGLALGSWIAFRAAGKKP